MSAMPMVNVNNADVELEAEKQEQLRIQVRRKVRRFEINDAEADQVVDEILDAWAGFLLDPVKAGGSKKEAVLHGIVSNCCKMALRRQARNRARDRQYAEAYSNEKSGPSVDWDVCHRLDVQDALSKLTLRDRLICEALANGVPLNAIEVRLGLSRHRLQALIESIRERFTALGLDGWLTE